MNIGGLVTVMSPDGKPIQVAANALQTGGAQQSVGRIQITTLIEILTSLRIVNKSS